MEPEGHVMAERKHTIHKQLLSLKPPLSMVVSFKRVVGNDLGESISSEWGHLALRRVFFGCEGMGRVGISRMGESRPLK